jgi:hypothetical protein
MATWMDKARGAWRAGPFLLRGLRDGGPTGALRARLRRSWGTIAGEYRRRQPDFRRITEDSVALFRYLLTRDAVDLGLGQLSAASGVAVRGQANRYAVNIASTRSEPVNVTLAIDIGAINAPALPDGQSAHVSKRLTALPGASTRVEIEYDWNTKAVFFVRDTPFPPDEIAAATLDVSARYAVTVTLVDSRGHRLDRLTVYQELTS